MDAALTLLNFLREGGIEGFLCISTVYFWDQCRRKDVTIKEKDTLVSKIRAAENERLKSHLDLLGKLALKAGQ